MPDPLARVTPGSPLKISATAWNLFTAAARDWQQGRPDQPAVVKRPSGYVEAIALNDTGADLDAFKPAKVTAAGGYDLTDYQSAGHWSRRPLLTIGTPGAATDIVAVTLEAIPDGKIGRVAVAGWCACDVDVTSSAHKYARPGTTTDALASAASGPIRILNTGSGTAVRTACYLFFGQHDGLDTPARTPIDFCVVKSGGNVTDIKVTWLNADGTTECETVPECTGGTCDVLWWCTTDGVVDTAAGSEPADWYAGPFTSYDDAVAACDADSGGPGEPGGGTASCCSRQLNTRLIASLSGGNGSMTLTWDGTYWSGQKTLSCGETLYLRYSTTCVVTFSCNGTNYQPATVPPGSVSCGPPFVDSQTWTCNMDDAGAGCVAGSCGSVDVTEVAE
jgi:hypothetical protein